MALFFLVFSVCLLIFGSMIGILLVSRTPRYRTEPEDLLALFDKTIKGYVTETEWNAIVGHPVRHDDYLESVRRRAQYLMDEYGRPWQVSQGGSLLSRTGRKELAALRDHLASHDALRHQQER
ncbi:hypothetical protein SAMN05443545_107300 [Aidingimonas halophila]|uniref:Uncharacterized protein n=2 Tax=Aidingimonas halophila TaxID=574349 RepID=A0A1H3EZ71_9GAMM|nr:hypothetical protein [Aidingimonas halophila]SDX84113.1 hypothetical protein SAMN05443545_107300 [Aidingimonas halophila]